MAWLCGCESVTDVTEPVTRITAELDLITGLLSPHTCNNLQLTADEGTGAVGRGGNAESVTLGAMVGTSAESKASSVKPGRPGKPGRLLGRLSVGTAPSTGL